MDPKDLREKEAKLEALVRELGPPLVAFSGGVDSTYLACKIQQVYGNRALAVTADSPALSSHQRRLAVGVAARLGLVHEFAATGETADERYRLNPPDRCYICKTLILDRLVDVARERGFRTIVDGSNLDDAGDFRPGRKAVEEHGIRSPLLEAGLTKSEIRELSRRAGLPTADEPAAACLASRFPCGIRITEEKLRLVDRGEEELRRRGFRLFRVRHHDDLARLEFGREELPRALDPETAARLGSFFKSLGYRYVTIDLEGYRMGSSNRGQGAEWARAGSAGRCRSAENSDPDTDPRPRM